MPHLELFRRGRAAAVLALFGLAFAGCAGTHTDSDPSALSRQMFEAGFDDIDAVYINKPDIGSLALAGMQQLSTSDPDVTARRSGDKVELLLKDQVANSRTVSSNYDAEDWGDLTADVLVEASQDSEKIKVTPTEKVYEAMFSGVVGKLDQFSRYAGAEAARENRAVRDGFGGIGVKISVEDQQVRIVSVQHYTPAERMGLKNDDLVLEINGESTKGLDQRQVVDRLRGPVDSKVDITVQRAEEADPFVVSITRAHVVPESVSYRREGDVAYFRIYSFNSETAASLNRSVSDAEQEIGPRLRGIVIDLRDNPGGLLNQAVAVSNLFLT